MIQQRRKNRRDLATLVRSFHDRHPEWVVGGLAHLLQCGAGHARKMLDVPSKPRNAKRDDVLMADGFGGLVLLLGVLEAERLCGVDVPRTVSRKRKGKA